MGVSSDELVPQRPAPTGWGSDNLTDFLDLTRSNQYASFVRIPAHYQKLADVDAAFVLICSNLNDPSDVFPPFFLLRAHSAFRAAVGLALAAQPPEAFMVMRGCLESALYGLYVARNPAMSEVWWAREDSEESRRAVKKEFTVANMWRCLKETDEKLQGQASLLYERSIGMGGHPNAAAFATALTTERGDSGIRFKLDYLNADPQMLTGTAKSVAQVGVTALEIFRHAFTQRYESLGLTLTLQRLREGL